MWAPTAQRVYILVFDDEGHYNEDGKVQDHENGQEHALTRDADGIWSL
ncbi:hypothetical protein, partial [Pseudomonas koreensis]